MLAMFKFESFIHGPRVQLERKRICPSEQLLGGGGLCQKGGGETWFSVIASTKSTLILPVTNRSIWFSVGPDVYIFHSKKGCLGNFEVRRRGPGLGEMFSRSHLHQAPYKCLWTVPYHIWKLLWIICVLLSSLFFFNSIKYWSVTSSNFSFCIAAFSWKYFSRTWWKTLTRQIWHELVRTFMVARDTAAWIPN